MLNYYYPWKLEQEMDDFIDHYNNRRHHKSLDFLTPKVVYFWASSEDEVQKGINLRQNFAEEKS